MPTGDVRQDADGHAADRQLQALSAPPAVSVDLGLRFLEALPLHLLQMWQGKCAGGALPKRADFDLLALRPHLGWLCVVEVCEHRDDLRYRLIGSRITDFVGRDMTGRLVSEVLPEAALHIYRHLIAYPRALRTHGSIVWRDKGHIPYETLILPLAADGRSVDGFMVEMVFPDWMPGARL